MSNYSIFKEKVFEEVPLIVMDENINVTPQIESQNSIFVGNKNLLERVHFIKKDSNTKLIHLFQEMPINKKTGRMGENSRIAFFNFNKFPDGCFFLMEETTKKIKCYICELKHRPGDKIEDIEIQFYMGFLHCKTFFAAVQLDEEYDIEYNFLLAGFIRLYDKFEKQLIVHGVTKASPGTVPEGKRHIKAYRNYKLGKMFFSYVEDYNKKFEFTFNYIQLDIVNKIDEDTLLIEKQFELSF